MDIKTETILVTKAMRLLGTGFKGITGNKYSGIDWVSEPTFSKEEFDAQVFIQKAEYDALQYQRDRRYPSIGDQLDMQYHDQIDGTTTWKDAIAKVKADNPKEAE